MVRKRRERAASVVHANVDSRHACQASKDNVLTISVNGPFYRFSVSNGELWCGPQFCMFSFITARIDDTADLSFASSFGNGVVGPIVRRKDDICTWPTFDKIFIKSVFHHLPTKALMSKSTLTAT